MGNWGKSRQDGGNPFGNVFYLALGKVGGGVAFDIHSVR